MVFSTIWIFTISYSYDAKANHETRITALENAGGGSSLKYISGICRETSVLLPETVVSFYGACPASSNFTAYYSCVQRVSDYYSSALYGRVVYLAGNSISGFNASYVQTFEYSYIYHD